MGGAAWYDTRLPGRGVTRLGMPASLSTRLDSDITLAGDRTPAAAHQIAEGSGRE